MIGHQGREKCDAGVKLFKGKGGIREKKSPGVKVRGKRGLALYFLLAMKGRPPGGKKET